MVMIATYLNNMLPPHPALHVKHHGAVVPRASKMEVISLCSQASSPTIGPLWMQLQSQKCYGGSGKVTVRTSCNSIGQSSVIDAEPSVSDPSGWHMETGMLTSASDELSGWEKIHGGKKQRASSQSTLGRKFIKNMQDSMNVAIHTEEGEEEGERSSGDIPGSEATSAHSPWYSNEDVKTKYMQARRRQECLATRPDKVRWRLYVEGVRSPPWEERAQLMRSRLSFQQKLQEKIMFLESLGLESSTLLADCPLLSTCPIDNIQAVVQFLVDCQLRRKDIVRILTHNPHLLGQSVDTTFRPVVEFLVNEVGLRENDVGKVVNRCARILTTSIDERLRPTKQFLQSLGFSHMPIVVLNNATLLTFSIETKLVPKIDYLQSLGFTNEEAIRALIRFPAIFNYSVEKNLQPKYAYLVEDMGRGLDDLKAFPQYFGYSLESRIQPRHQFLKKQNLVLSLPNILRPSDEEFYAQVRNRKVATSPVIRKSGHLCESMTS